MDFIICQCQKWGKIFTGPTYKLLLSFTVISDVYRSFILYKLHILSTVLFSGFQSSRELWNPLSKAVPGKFHGSDGHSKCSCLQDRTNFHRSQAWQIALIFKTDMPCPSEVFFFFAYQWISGILWHAISTGLAMEILQKCTEYHWRLEKIVLGQRFISTAIEWTKYETKISPLFLFWIRHRFSVSHRNDVYMYVTPCMPFMLYYCWAYLGKLDPTFYWYRYFHQFLTCFR